MKQKIKSMIALTLCAMIVIAGIISTGTDAAYAASKTPLKVTFKKKTVTLMKDINKAPTRPKVKTLTEKWGIPKKETWNENPENKAMETAKRYTWKKGKTTILYHIQKYKDPMWISAHSYIEIKSADKNLTVLGVKVGTKKETAKKVLEKLGGETNETGSYTELHLNYGSEDFTSEDFGPVLRVGFEYKNGKVSSISVEINNI